MSTSGKPGCTRLCQTGRPCRKTAIDWCDDWRHFAPTLPDPVSCIIHMTAEERADLDETRARGLARVKALGDVDPACWSWSVPAPHDLGSSEGLTEEALQQYEGAARDFLRDWQNDRCAVCEYSWEVVDHDHKTGLVRGLLCVSCNAREGHGNGGRFLKYRESHPASILGVRIRYYSPITGYAEPEGPRNEYLDPIDIYELAADLADWYDDDTSTHRRPA